MNRSQCAECIEGNNSHNSGGWGWWEAFKNYPYRDAEHYHLKYVCVSDSLQMKALLPPLPPPHTKKVKLGFQPALLRPE